MRTATCGWNTKWWATTTTAWKRGAADFKRLLALRGLGFLAGFEGDRDHLKVHINNSCLHLLMVGIVQALAEPVYKSGRSACAWDLSGEGDLEVSVRP